MLETSPICCVSVLRRTAAECKHPIIYAEWMENDGENKADVHFPLVCPGFFTGIKENG